MSTRSENPSDARQHEGIGTVEAPTSFVNRTLINIAMRRAGVDALRCELTLLHIETAKLLHRSLQAVLTRNDLTELQFALLVTLFSTEPEPLAVSVLAEHVMASRSAVGDALDQLEALRCASRSHNEFDRRITYARITPAGQETVDRAINEYLHVAELAARHVRSASQRAMLGGYLDLLRAHEPSADTSA